MLEQSDPAAASANHVKVYAKDTGGVSRLYLRDDTAVKQLLVEGEGGTSFPAGSDLSMGSHKLTSLTPGSASTDAANVGQLFGATGAISGKYFIPQMSVATAFSANAGTLNLAQAVPILLRAGTLDRIAINLNNTATAGENVALAIYNDAGGYPGTVLLDTGDFAITSTGVKAATISQAVNTGIYWLAMVRHGGSALGQIVTFGGNTNTNAAMAVNVMTDQTDLFSTGHVGYSQSGVTGSFGTWTATPTLTASQLAPLIAVRYS